MRAEGHVALAGGSTPRRAHELARRRQDWTRVTFWWSDERCVPPDDERSNFGLARRTLLEHLAAGPAAVHRIGGELPPAEAADEYDRALRGVTIDLNLLGIGPDGHTASLFPGMPSL